MKKLSLFLIFLSLPLLGAPKKTSKIKLNTLKVKYNQLIKKPVKNEAKIRDIIRQVRPVDEEWAQDAATRLTFIINQSKGGGIRKIEAEEAEVVIPTILPGVPTPPEYLDKPELDMPDFPAIEIPVEEESILFEEFEQEA